MDYSTLILRSSPFPIEGVVISFVLLPCFIEMSVFNANRVDPDLKPRSSLFANALFMGHYAQWVNS